MFQHAVLFLHVFNYNHILKASIFQFLTLPEYLYNLSVIKTVVASIEFHDAFSFSRHIINGAPFAQNLIDLS